VDLCGAKKAPIVGVPCPWDSGQVVFTHQWKRQGHDDYRVKNKVSTVGKAKYNHDYLKHPLT